MYISNSNSSNISKPIISSNNNTTHIRSRPWSRTSNSNNSYINNSLNINNSNIINKANIVINTNSNSSNNSHNNNNNSPQKSKRRHKKSTRMVCRLQREPQQLILTLLNGIEKS